MSTTLTISRTLLSLSNLVLPTGVIDFMPVEHGGRHWDRTYAQSPWVHGRTLTGARMQPSSIAVEFFIDTTYSSSQATHATALDALIDALSQFTYTITQVVGNQTDQWTCEPAEIDPGVVPHTRALQWRRQLVKAVVPVSPVPVQGVW